MTTAKRTTKAATTLAADTAEVINDTAEVVTKTAEEMTAVATNAATDMMEMFKMPAKSFPDMFKFQPTEVPPMFRDWAEKSVGQVREAYDKVRAGTEETSDMMEDTFETIRKGMVDFNLKTLEATKANADATFDFFKKAMATKSVSETVELQASFARECMDTYAAQARDMQEFGQKFSEDVTRPVKDSVSKAMSEIKAA